MIKFDSAVFFVGLVGFVGVCIPLISLLHPVQIVGLTVLGLYAIAKSS